MKSYPKKLIMFWSPQKYLLYYASSNFRPNIGNAPLKVPFPKVNYKTDWAYLGSVLIQNLPSLLMSSLYYEMIPLISYELSDTLKKVSGLSRKAAHIKNLV